MELRAKIGLAKRQLSNMADVLDELYTDVMAVQREKIKQIKKEIKQIVKDTQSPVQKDAVVEQIMKRMVYLNRIKDKPLMEANARIDELSRLLDWIEESSLDSYGN